MVTTEQTLISISDSAAKELLNLISRENDHSKYLRIGVKGGGCSGLTYILDFTHVKDSDDRFISNGIEYIVDKGQALYLKDVSLNFGSGLDNRGFTFENPNATEKCGCGTSFAI